MGMYSSFIYEEITTKTKFDDLSILLLLKNGGVSEEDREGLTELLNQLITDDGEISFEGWDSHKIEGYWYESTIKILRLLAPYLEGYAEFEYEEGYKFRIVFENNKPFFQKEPEVDWDSIEKGEL